MPNWKDVLEEFQSLQRNSQLAIDIVRRRYIEQLQQHTKRNIIAYYSGFLSKPGILQSDINDEDKNGFMMAVHKLDRSIGLDLILHTPGGSIAATESIVDYLHQMFNDNIRAFVPQIAMSAGTMIACSCKEIWMAKHSNLGPTDPHLAGLPARGIIEEFDRACDEIKKDPSRIPVWQAIISRYTPTFLSQCQNAIDWSNAFVQSQLETIMFNGRSDAKSKAAEIVQKLTDYKGNKAHERHIHFDECQQMGLNVHQIESDPILQDLLLTVHHSFMHALMNTSTFKLIENHNGAAFVKHARSEQIRQ